MEEQVNIKQRVTSKVVLLLIVLLFFAVAIKEMILTKFPGQDVTNAKHKTIRIQLEAIKAALDLYKFENGKYPDKIDSLFSYEKKYVFKKEFLYDLWGRQFFYQFDESKNEYAIISFGADGKPGGIGLDKDISLRFHK